MNRRNILGYISILSTSIYSYLKNIIYKKENDIEIHNLPWKNEFKLYRSNLHNRVEKIEGKLQIHNINVAHGDSTIIITPNNKLILLDTGHKVHDGKYVIDYLQTQNITHIDYLITTHAHWDHIGGANEIINKYENELDGIDYILNTGVPHTSKTYQNYINRIDSFTGKQIKIREDDKLDIDNELDIKILNPESDINNELSLNDNSLVLHITHKDTSIILPSDIEEYSEKRLINKYGDTLNADIYKVGHHGNNSSTSYEFIKQINPDISLISSSYHSQFSHPHDSVINTLSDFSKSTYWTGVHGSIIAVSDGKNWNIYPQMKKTTIPSKIKNEKQVNCAPDAGFEI